MAMGQQSGETEGPSPDGRPRARRSATCCQSSHEPNPGPGPTACYTSGQSASGFQKLTHQGRRQTAHVQTDRQGMSSAHTRGTDKNGTGEAREPLGDSSTGSSGSPVNTWGTTVAAGGTADARALGWGWVCPERRGCFTRQRPCPDWRPLQPRQQ